MYESIVLKKSTFEVEKHHSFLPSHLFSWTPENLYLHAQPLPEVFQAKVSDESRERVPSRLFKW
jgi:hypothetical protein